jgi:alkylation response protein AidB-like acyl-CoA dehydrogenase
MDLGLSEAQELLRRNAREVLEETCPQTHVREVEEKTPGISRGLWRSMADLGWLGLGAPSSAGGSDGDAVDLAVLAEELGRVNAPVPWLSTAVLATKLLADSGREMESGLVQRIVDGEAIVALAIREEDAGYSPNSISTAATASGDGYILNGLKMFVADGANADWLIVLARSGEGSGENGLGLFLVEAGAPGVTVEWQPNTSGEGLALVRLESARATSVLGRTGEGWRRLQGPTLLAAALHCRWMLGGADRALEMAVEYAKTRVQFGRPIGSFQAVSHKLAECKWKLTAARALTDRAIVALAEDDDPETPVSMAMAYTGTAVRNSMHSCHEVFAGIGFMKIHDLQLYYRRLKVAESRFGDVYFHRRNIAKRELLGARSA